MLTRFAHGTLPYPRMRDALGRTTELRAYLSDQYRAFLCPDYFGCVHPLCLHFFERFMEDTRGRWDGTCPGVTPGLADGCSWTGVSQTKGAA